MLIWSRAADVNCPARRLPHYSGRVAHHWRCGTELRTIDGMPIPPTASKPGPPLTKRFQRVRRFRLPAHLHLSDIQGLAQLVAQGTLGAAGLTERVHGNVVKAVAGVLGPLGSKLVDPRPGSSGIKPRSVTGLVYGSIRGMARLAGGAVDAALAGVVPLASPKHSSPQREAVLSALNGVLGDRLEATGNPLAIEMQFRSEGAPLPLHKPALAQRLPATGPKVLVMVHGLCMNDLQWRGHSAAGHYDHGQLLASTLGYTPIYLHYNTGKHIYSNGQEFSDLLEQLLVAWPQPVQELVLLTHSMGGLVARSAYFQALQAGCHWSGRLKSLLFLGTPHHGAPLERVGGWIDTVLGSQAVTRPFASIAKVRSAGITDLRHGQLLPPGSVQTSQLGGMKNAQFAVPLPDGVACYAVAGSTGAECEGEGRLLSVRQALRQALVGDGLVPVNSALGLHENPALSLAFAPARQRIFQGTDHIALLTKPEVGAQLRLWLT